jgi:hypothetical protein
MKETMEGAIWTIDNIDKYLKMRNLRINKNELYRKYFNRYHGSNTVVY